jgi:hypothetical protein
MGKESFCPSSLHCPIVSHQDACTSIHPGFPPASNVRFRIFRTQGSGATSMARRPARAGIDAHRRSPDRESKVQLPRLELSPRSRSAGAAKPTSRANSTSCPRLATSAMIERGPARLPTAIVTGTRGNSTPTAIRGVNAQSARSPSRSNSAPVCRSQRGPRPARLWQAQSAAPYSQSSAAPARRVRNLCLDSQPTKWSLMDELCASLASTTWPSAKSCAHCAFIVDPFCRPVFSTDSCASCSSFNKCLAALFPRSAQANWVP